MGVKIDYFLYKLSQLKLACGFYFFAPQALVGLPGPFHLHMYTAEVDGLTDRKDHPRGQDCALGRKGELWTGVYVLTPAFREIFKVFFSRWTKMYWGWSSPYKPRLGRKYE